MAAFALIHLFGAFHAGYSKLRAGQHPFLLAETTVGARDGDKKFAIGGGVDAGSTGGPLAYLDLLLLDLSYCKDFRVDPFVLLLSLDELLVEFGYRSH